MSDLQLNDLQKLSVNYLQAVSQLNIISALTGNVIGFKMANHHIPLIKSILGEEIMDLMENASKSRAITRQAEDFYELMIEEEPNGDMFGSSQN